MIYFQRKSTYHGLDTVEYFGVQKIFVRQTYIEFQFDNSNNTADHLLLSHDDYKAATLVVEAILLNQAKYALIDANIINMLLAKFKKVTASEQSGNAQPTLHASFSMRYYEKDAQNVCSTVCPFRAATINEGPVMIGSITCKACEYFCGIETADKYVLCSYKETSEIYK